MIRQKLGVKAAYIPMSTVLGKEIDRVIDLLTVADALF